MLRNVSQVVVRRELEVVASLDLEEVGEKVGGLESKVPGGEKFRKSQFLAIFTREEAEGRLTR